MWSWPLWLLAAAAALYNLLAIADSSVYSTALADVVAPHRLGVAYSVRSVMGFGAGAISPWVFGLALDWGQRASAWAAPIAGSPHGPRSGWAHCSAADDRALRRGWPAPPR